MKTYGLPVLAALLMVAAGLIFSPASEAQMGYGMHHGMYGGGSGYGQGGGWSYCPYCGSDMRGRGGYPMGPGMMGPGYGRQGMGPGMMGPNYGRPYDYPDDRRYPRYRRQPLEKEDVPITLRLARAERSSIDDLKDIRLAGAEGKMIPLGELTRVDEYRVELVCEPQFVRAAVAALLEAHPYEEPAWHVLALVTELPG